MITLRSKANRRAISLLILSLSFFALGFLATLALHYKVRPETIIDTSANTSVAVQQNEVAIVASAVENSLISQLPLNEIIKANENLLNHIFLLESDLDQKTDEHNINEGHARALLSEIQTYRKERNVLFQSLQNQKQQLTEKIAELDSTIQQQIETRQLTYEPQDDYQIRNELVGLLAYPHPLNDNILLNEHFLAQPKNSKEYVERRFELMLQPIDYDHNNNVYDVLESIIESLNKLHNNNTEIFWAHCTAKHCEVQITLQRLLPYFDYWQQILNELKKFPATKVLINQTSTDNGNTLVGAVIIEKLL